MTATLLQFPSNRFLRDDLLEVMRWTEKARRHGWYLRTGRQPSSKVEHIVTEDETGAQFVCLTQGHPQGEVRHRVERRGRQWVVRDLTARGSGLTTHASLAAALASILSGHSG